MGLILLDESLCILYIQYIIYKRYARPCLVCRNDFHSFAVRIEQFGAGRRYLPFKVFYVVLHILAYNTHWAHIFCRSLLIRQFNWCFRNENKNIYIIYNIYTYYCKCGILPILLNHICSSLYFVFNARLVSNEI